MDGPSLANAVARQLAVVVIVAAVVALLVGGGIGALIMWLL